MLKRLHWVGPVAGVALVLLVAGLLAFALFGSEAVLAKVGIWTGILGFALAALGVALPLIRRIPGERGHAPGAVDEDARALAEAVRIAEVRNLRRIVGGDELARLRLATDGAASKPSRVKPDGAEEQGLLLRLRELLRFSGHDRMAEGLGGTGHGHDAMDLTQMAAHFRALPRPRMVVLGPPGAGKTVLLNAFAVQWLRTATGQEPIPVRADLAAYDPETRELAPWLAERIATQYRITLSRARGLVGAGRVLPLLDGLDEMDRDPGSPDRAVAALRRIDAYVAGSEFGVVLACREHEWAQIGMGVPGASMIRIHPLEAETIRHYVRARVAEQGMTDEAWRPVVERVAAEPYGTLAEVLNRPLWLYLAVRVHGSSPQDLLTSEGAVDLRQRLLAGFIPTAAGREGPYAEADVQRWLRELAIFLERPRDGGVATADLVPDRLWPIAGRRLIPRLHTLLLALIPVGVGLLGLPAWQVFFTTLGDEERQGSSGTIALVIVLLALVILGSFVATLRSSWTPSVIGRPRLRRPRMGFPTVRSAGAWLRRRVREAVVEMRGVTLMLAGALTVAGWVGYLVDAPSLTPRLVLGVVAGGLMIFGILCVGFSLAWLVGGIVLAPVAAVVDFAPREPRRPYDLLLFDRAAGLATVLALAAAASLLSEGRPSTAEAGLTVLLAWALITLISGVAVRYALAVAVLAAMGREPLRLRRFLDWAVDAGVLREAGTAYQFRHIELQRWLAAVPRTPPGGDRNSAGVGLEAE